MPIDLHDFDSQPEDMQAMLRQLHAELDPGVPLRPWFKGFVSDGLAQVKRQLENHGMDYEQFLTAMRNGEDFDMPEDGPGPRVHTADRARSRSRKKKRG